MNNFNIWIFCGPVSIVYIATVLKRSPRYENNKVSCNAFLKSDDRKY